MRVLPLVEGGGRRPPPSPPLHYRPCLRLAGVLQEDKFCLLSLLTYIYTSEGQDNGGGFFPESVANLPRN